jgi:hypothetical protein
VTSQIFLLSPALCSGRRATFIRRADAAFPAAVRLRDGTLTLGEAFAFLSGLYFRGKLAYAHAFARPWPDGAGLLIITPTRGLLPADAPVSASLLDEFAGVDIAAEDRRYAEPLERDLAALASAAPPEARVVLLGSVATPKYAAPLARALGGRLHFPVDFIGRGDMSRGALMLRHVAAGAEMEYVALDAAARLRGPRPPRLAPLRAPEGPRRR